MTRLTRWLILSALLLVIIPCMMTLGLSASYWGHWFGPPSSEPTIAPLSRIEKFTTFSRMTPPKPDFQTAQPNISTGLPALETAAKSENYAWGDDPLGRIPAQLLRKGLVPKQSQSIDVGILRNIKRILEKDKYFVYGTGRYQNSSSSLHGHIIYGVTQSNEPIYVAALSSGEVENDHYVYYEVLLDEKPGGNLLIRKIQRYNYDIAGLEGTLVFPLIGGVIAILGLILLMILGVISLTKNSRKHRNKKRQLSGR